MRAWVGEIERKRRKEGGKTEEGKRSGRGRGMDRGEGRGRNKREVEG